VERRASDLAGSQTARDENFGQPEWVAMGRRRFADRLGCVLPTWEVGDVRGLAPRN